MSKQKEAILTISFLVLFLLIVFLFYFFILKENAQENLQTSDAAHALSIGEEVGFTDINGNPVSLDTYLGKTIIALAWASWCSSCAQQLMLLAEVSDSNPDFVILAFNRAEPVTTAKDFLQYYGLEASVQLIMDPNDHFFTSVAGYSMPETVIFDSQGTIRHHERGEISRVRIEQILEELRQE